MKRMDLFWSLWRRVRRIFSATHWVDREIDVERRAEERERRCEIFAVPGPRTLSEPVRVRRLRRRPDIYTTPNVSEPPFVETIRRAAPGVSISSAIRELALEAAANRGANAR